MIRGHRGDGADIYYVNNTGDTVIEAGSDTFVFGPATAASSDRVSDFSSAAHDRIGIEADDYGLSIGHGLNANGTLDADYFEAGTKATKDHAEFLFNTANKTLYFDNDGAGSHAAVAVASFGVPAGTMPANFLHSTDFLLL